MQNSISKLNLIQNNIDSKVSVLKPKESYLLEVTLDTSKLSEIPILGNPFLTRFENGTQTLACIEVDVSGELPDQVTLMIKPDSNQLIHQLDGVSVVFRRLVSSPRGKGVCWESRPAYLEDVEEMDSNSIAIEDANELYYIAFGH